MTTPSTPPAKGLICPRCGCQHFSVAYTRPRPGFILRARDCRHCGKRIVTREQVH
jgi:transcriptional regulator NrdR family protein